MVRVIHNKLLFVVHSVHLDLDGALTLVIRTDPTAEVIERVGSYAQLLAGSPAAIQDRRNEKKRDNACYLGDPPSTVLPPLWG